MPWPAADQGLKPVPCRRCERVLTIHHVAWSISRVGGMPARPGFPQGVVRSTRIHRCGGETDPTRCQCSRLQFSQQDRANRMESRRMEQPFVAACLRSSFSYSKPQPGSGSETIDPRSLGKPASRVGWHNLPMGRSPPVKACLGFSTSRLAPGITKRNLSPGSANRLREDGQSGHFTTLAPMELRSPVDQMSA
jgi:hypothetical protein